MPEVCGEPHPDNPEITCDKEIPCFLTHINRATGEAWAGAEDPRKETRHQGRTRKRELADMAARVPISQSAGEPLREIQGRHGSGSFDGKVKSPAWVAQAIETFKTMLTERFNTDFTTPEDLWPLLDAPQDMREMVQVVRHALRENWIEEVAAKRLTGTYRTRDGVEFKMNKLVPVYRSKLIVLHIVPEEEAQDALAEPRPVTACFPGLLDFG